MAKVTYRGPGDMVSLDGIDVDKDETVELGEEQIRRLEAAGSELEVDRTVPAPPQAPTTTWKPEDDATPATTAKKNAGTTGKED
jgi:hypothetical protein